MSDYTYLTIEEKIEVARIVLKKTGLGDKSIERAVYCVEHNLPFDSNDVLTFMIVDTVNEFNTLEEIQGQLEYYSNEATRAYRAINGIELQRNEIDIMVEDEEFRVVERSGVATAYYGGIEICTVSGVDFTPLLAKIDYTTAEELGKDCEFDSFEAKVVTAIRENFDFKTCTKK